MKVLVFERFISFQQFLPENTKMMLLESIFPLARWLTRVSVSGDWDWEAGVRGFQSRAGLEIL